MGPSGGSRVTRAMGAHASIKLLGADLLSALRRVYDRIARQRCTVVWLLSSGAQQSRAQTFPGANAPHHSAVRILYLQFANRMALTAVQTAALRPIRGTCDCCALPNISATLQLVS